MPKVRANSSARWVRRAASSTQDYADGIASPRTDWHAATIAAAAAQAAGVQAAITAKSFERGVSAAGTSKWARKAAGIGATRFGPGVADAESDYQKGVAPYLAAISNLTLPPRGAKGDPKNLERVRVVAMTLRKLKTG